VCDVMLWDGVRCTPDPIPLMNVGIIGSAPRPDAGGNTRNGSSLSLVFVA
jgi:hypothetical protein